MAFDKAPATWLPNYTLGTNQAIFNTSDHASPTLPDLDNTDAHATTGDVRQVTLGILEAMYDAWLATAIIDRPLKMTMSRTTAENSDGNIIRSFYVSFVTDPTVGLHTISE